MSDVKQLPSRPVSIERILRPQTKIDLVVAENSLTGQVDIRSSMILDLPPGRLIVAQTVPPLGKAQIQRQMEVSIVHRDRTTSEIVRWGWTATVLGLDNKYELNPGQPAISIFSLSRPDDPSSLAKSNIRQAYRLEIGQGHDIALTVNPMPAPVQLLNFSAGGFMFSTPAPSCYELYQELSFELTFPADKPLPAHSLKGRAVVVRQELVGPGEKTAYLGLKFQDLKPEYQLVLPKLLTFYMLEEQRRRRQDNL